MQTGLFFGSESADLQLEFEGVNQFYWVTPDAVIGVDVFDGGNVVGVYTFTEKAAVDCAKAEVRNGHQVIKVTDIWNEVVKRVGGQPPDCNQSKCGQLPPCV